MSESPVTGLHGEDERALLKRISAGEEDALGELFDRYSGILCGLASRIAGSPDEADDVVYDVFLQAWNRAASYRPERGSVLAWLIGLARKRLAISMRAREEQGVVLNPGSFRLFSDPVGSPALQAPASSALGTLAVDAFRRLGEPQRNLLILACFCGLGEENISARLHLPVGRLRADMRKSLTAIRATLGEKL